MNIDKNRRQALKAYHEKQDRIPQLMQCISEKLKDDAGKKGINWASVGSLGHVEELLAQINDFLG